MVDILSYVCFSCSRILAKQKYSFREITEGLSTENEIRATQIKTVRGTLFDML